MGDYHQYRHKLGKIGPSRLLIGHGDQSCLLCFLESVLGTEHSVSKTFIRVTLISEKSPYRLASDTNFSLTLFFPLSLVFCLTITVDLGGIEANDTKEGQIMIGEEGTKVAKDISSRIEAAIEKGNFSLNVNGIVFITNRESMNISDPKPHCKKGQTHRDGYCRK